jgi:hypothetical protein
MIDRLNKIIAELTEIRNDLQAAKEPFSPLVVSNPMTLLELKNSSSDIVLKQVVLRFLSKKYADIFIVENFRKLKTGYYRQALINFINENPNSLKRQYR